MVRVQEQVSPSGSQLHCRILCFFFPPSITRILHFQDLVNAAAGFLVSITGDTTKLITDC